MFVKSTRFKQVCQLLLSLIVVYSRVHPRADQKKLGLILI